jgi:hypothetical protein
MKRCTMHLLPCADMDLDCDKTYNSAWITLPNSCYDPKKGAKLYNRYLDELEHAGQLSFDDVFVKEIRLNAYGLMPQQGTMAVSLDCLREAHGASTP